MERCVFAAPRAAFFQVIRFGAKVAIANVIFFMSFAPPSPAQPQSSDAASQPFNAEKVSNAFPPYVALRDGAIHDLRAQIAGHESLLAQQNQEGDRIVPGVLRLRIAPRDPDQRLNSRQDRLVLLRSGSIGSVSIVDGSPRSFSFRLSVADTPKSSAVVDVAGLYRPQSAGRSERDGVWAAWERTKAVIVVSRYRQGTLEECYLFANGRKERVLSLDDDMSRDRGTVPHRYIAKAMDAASEAVVEASRQTALTDQVANRKQQRDQKRLAYQQFRYAAQSRGVDQELDAVAYREALRSTMATMPHEIFPCVPSRHALIVSPVNLLGRRENSSY